MPRFCTNDLLLAFTLTALGLGVPVAFLRNEYWWWLCFYSPPLICAGILTLFRKAWIGVGIGLLLDIVVFMALFLWAIFSSI